jgi:predicted transcriptional regulator of viral defense system
MKTVDAIKQLAHYDKTGRYVYVKRDLSKVFETASENTLNQMLKRLIAQGVLIRAAQGVYVFAQSAHLSPTTVEDVAIALRPGEYIFESLESALSQWGRISQIPSDRITLVTTGRKGEHRTPYGVIEFTHTNSSPLEIIKNTIRRPHHPLPIATEEYALANLKRTGRNLNMVQEKG